MFNPNNMVAFGALRNRQARLAQEKQDSLMAADQARRDLDAVEAIKDRQFERELKVAEAQSKLAALRGKEAPTGYRSGAVGEAGAFGYESGQLDLENRDRQARAAADEAARKEASERWKATSGANAELDKTALSGEYGLEQERLRGQTARATAKTYASRPFAPREVKDPDDVTLDKVIAQEAKAISNDTNFAGKTFDPVAREMGLKRQQRLDAALQLRAYGDKKGALKLLAGIADEAPGPRGMEFVPPGTGLPPQPGVDTGQTPMLSEENTPEENAAIMDAILQQARQPKKK